MGEVARQVVLRELEDRVRSPGRVGEVRAFWGDQSLALSLFDTEGSPNEFLEAPFAGRLMVSIATGGTPDVIGDKRGFVVALDHHGAATRAVERLVGDATIRLRPRAHRTCRAILHHGSVIAGHVSAIREVCG